MKTYKAKLYNNSNPETDECVYLYTNQYQDIVNDLDYAILEWTFGLNREFYSIRKILNAPRRFESLKSGKEYYVFRKADIR